MSFGSRHRYVLRPIPFVLIGCLAGAIAGAEIGGGAMLVAGMVEQRNLDPYPNTAEGLGGALWSVVFWSIFLLPAPLADMVIVGWPALFAVLKWRREWLSPMLIYVLGALAGGVGEVIKAAPHLLFPSPLIASLGPITPQMMLTACLSAFLMGAAYGLPAAVVFRLIALRRQA
jgi:hypothetical protein